MMPPHLVQQYHSIVLESEHLIEQVVQQFSPRAVLTSSFGTHSAALLRLATLNGLEEAPVIFVRHPFITPETVEFAATLQREYRLDVKVYESRERHSIEKVREALLENSEMAEYYRCVYKREPLERALRELGARAWVSGVRRDESPSRAHLQKVMQREDGLSLVYPLAFWDERLMTNYFQAHNLPMNHAYFDIFKETHEKKECGLHSFAR